VQLGAAAPGHAVETIAVLNALRRNDPESAVQLLEASLDADVLTFSLAQLSRPSRFDAINLEAKNRCLVAIVAKYRALHPSQNVLPETRDQVREVLKRLVPEDPFPVDARRLTSGCS
jgi:hypothetical protein